ncbi:YoaK family protein [Mycetocola spongiae]|uniref:YoaK family protein n=1 Tax=Mycetocola spongiae TaxID=2859226 RepID=UPI001CF1C1D9|nr:YoaK family protein [Mycetocola spongiae]UCR89744.1 DUF1275 domain-containing protein [Mycetocola spongiae]
MPTPPPASRDRLHLILMLALTFSTGIIDAVGYLGLDRVFTGNMTGNVVILGMGILGADDLPVVGPLIALAAFIIGAVIGGRALRPIAEGWTVRSTLMIAITGLILAGTAVICAISPAAESETVQFLVTGLLGLGMGIQAATARHLAVADITTVVVTSTITGLAADSRLAGGTGARWQRRVLAISLIGLGALTGAATLLLHLSVGLALAAALTLVVAWIGHPRAGAPAAG